MPSTTRHDLEWIIYSFVGHSHHSDIIPPSNIPDFKGEKKRKVAFNSNVKICIIGSTSGLDESSSGNN